MAEITLFDYWRSSASYRVRIALNLKGLDYNSVAVDLVKGEHKSPAHLARQPQGIVPAIEIDGKVLTQSLAIIEYLDEVFGPVALMPDDVSGRQRVRALSYAIAMEIHPVCNLSVVNHVVALGDGGEEGRKAWMQKFIRAGLEAFEVYLGVGATGDFCHGNQPGLADCCLVPQLYNAARWGADFSDLSTICAIHERCCDLPAFDAAYPDKVRPE
jgi:maleylacetoacetate isomerase